MVRYLNFEDLTTFGQMDIFLKVYFFESVYIYILIIYILRFKKANKM